MLRVRGISERNIEQMANAGYKTVEDIHNEPDVVKFDIDGIAAAQSCQECLALGRVQGVFQVGRVDHRHLGDTVAQNGVLLRSQRCLPFQIAPDGRRQDLIEGLTEVLGIDPFDGIYGAGLPDD